MARRPEADYKILQDNRSSYNLIAHQQHVPNTPLFRGGYGGDQSYRDRQGGVAGQGGDVSYRSPRGYDRNPPAPDNYASKTSPRRELDLSNLQRPANRIKHDANHVPQSPLYIQGNSPRRSGYEPQESNRTTGAMAGVGTRAPDPEELFGGDPRYGDTTEQQPWKKDTGRSNDDQNRQDEGPPTPNYNATHLRFEEDREDYPTDFAPPLSTRTREHDIRDFRGNPMPPRGGYYRDRLRRGEDMQDKRTNPWATQPPGRLEDPRMGNGPGISIQGTVRNGGALLFIRFPSYHGENISVAAHAFLKAKVHDNGGRFLGMAKKVYDFGYEHSNPEAIGVYHFPTMDKALLFFQLDTVLRQPDFPPPYGHAQMWIVCNAYLPDNMDLFNTFLLSEIELHPGKDKRTFFEEFQVKFERHLYANGAMPFVICSYGPHDRQSIRRHAYPHHMIVTCHLFQGLDHLKWVTEEEQYCKFRSLHNQMALEKCSVFSLSRGPL